MEDEIEYPVQINGKLKAKITVSSDADDKAIEQMALADEKVVAQIDGMTVRKIIVGEGADGQYCCQGLARNTSNAACQR